MNTSYKRLLSLFLLVSPFFAAAQKRPINFLLGQLPAETPPVSYSIGGWGSPYTGTNYTLFYGRQNAGTAGFNRIIKLFEVDGETYSVTKAVPGAKPFREVVVHRSSATVKTTALFEVATTPPSANNSNIYITPDYVGTMEELINSYIINRGTDNVFANGTGATTNNIERVDMLLDIPVNTTGMNRNQSGFLLMERGGNDPFKIAAITQVSGNNVTEFRTPVNVVNSHWGNAVSIRSLVMQRVIGTDANLKPSQNIDPQQVSGVFIPLSALNIPTNGTIYGISIFGNDVSTDPASLLDISNTTTYPRNTDGSSAGGIDFMAGGGFFTRAILINGSVWHDVDANAVKAAGENGIANDFWANLTDPSGRVISSVQVAADGSFRLFVADNNVSTGDYKVILTNVEKYEDELLTVADHPLNGYGYTGTNFGSTADPANRSGIINIGTIADVDINGIDFGINATVLPVVFSGISAVLNGSELVVSWNTASETNNSHFDVEISADGVNFVKAGTVTTKATDGNASASIHYEFKLGNVAGVALKASALFALFIVLAGRRRKLFFASLAFCLLVGVAGSCVKSDAHPIGSGEDYFVRIKQVDKDGNHRYSKVIKVLR